MRYYAMGIQYDTDGLEIVGLPPNMIVETDSIDRVVDIISDKVGWLVSSVNSITPFNSSSDGE